ncbi:hypothetical protein VTN77DRAFT_3508 [Rasamsonia byssochlamydoides]|uniref:uncharacterized protein n=1 Tax=Rasamsonia byssochlamydoides TaxID=89139 RepID=UPI0037447852
MARDLAGHVLDLARQSSTSLESYEVAIAHLADAEAHAGPASDIAVIYGAVRAKSGLPFKNWLVPIL